MWSGGTDDVTVPVLWLRDQKVKNDQVQRDRRAGRPGHMGHCSIWNIRVNTGSKTLSSNAPVADRKSGKGLRSWARVHNDMLLHRCFTSQKFK
ncbi:hypothetical protein ElyMa_005398000 [Elysia marginata]|uniref:Ig-like domain-containing protein n=1 Tax=Elysia marginata TaxID=1093978 RepID=A0AAV4EGS3_9GAST|nr:hypothetical protein ElyMa_005398000 [Elysia marginata]